MQSGKHKRKFSDFSGRFVFLQKEKMNIKGYFIPQDNNQFKISNFLKPPSFYWPAYFWVWNDSMTPDILIKQLHDMYIHKALSVCPLPEPHKFRPLSMNTQMDPDYLTKEYLQLYQLVVKEAKRLNMNVWLYDEGGWPSGSACGRVVKSDASLAQQSLKCTKIYLTKGDSVQIPANTIAAWVYYKNTSQRLKPGETYNANEENVILEIFNVKRVITRSLFHPLYPDLLNSAATKRFIELTHEAYKQVVGKYFGNTIFRTFFDEIAVPSVIPGEQIPWTNDLANEFYQFKRYNLIEHLPCLFANPYRVKSVEDMRVRIDFFDVWSRKFAKSCLRQIRQWCQSNNLLSAGHFAGVAMTIGAVKHGFGHILRVMRELDIPGVDTVWRQLFPGKTNHHFPKYASTSAHQQGKPWAFTESFCVYGNGLTLEQMKWLTNYPYVRGINLMVCGCYPLSTKNHFMAGERPHFGPVNPLWKYIENYHNYTARLGYLLSLGKPMIRTAAYYPVRDLWAGGVKMEKVDESNDMLVKLLLENQCDFDFIDDDVLEDPSTQIVNGDLKVGDMHYDTIWISQTEWMSEESMKKLACFVTQGGCINCIYTIPKSGGPESKRLDNFLNSSNNHKLQGTFNTISTYKEFTQHVAPLVKVEPKCSSLHICARYLENGTLYFLTNEGDSDINCTIHFNETRPAIQLDAETGKCWTPSNIYYSNGICSIPFHFSFAGSYLILFTEDKIPLSDAPCQAGSVLLTLSDGWSCRRLRSYKIGKHDFEIKERLKERAVPIQLGDWRNFLKEDFSGDAEYFLKFKCPKNIVEKAALLDLGDVRYACEVFLNDRNLGKRSWHPFSFLISGVIKEGINELRVIVTNTLANQLTSSKVLMDWSKNKGQGWPGPYHKIALEFEESSGSSGLFGPVKIFAVKKIDS